MTNLKREDGQALVLTALFLTLVLGMTALVLDVGSWYREQRQAQTAVDAAALAGAQKLPDGPGASSLALDFSGRNEGEVLGADVTFSSKWSPNDTINVKETKAAPGFFAKLFGLDSVTVGAKASARSQVPDEVRWAAPIVVNKLHPQISGPGCPCFGVPTTLPLAKNGAPGAFDLVNLDSSSGGTGQTILASWINKGFAGYLQLGEYYSDAGAKFNASEIQAAFAGKIGEELLFPVYDKLVGSGSGAQYRVIGWIGFRLTSFDDGSARGSSGSLTGYFTRVIWEGIQNETGPSTPDFGVRSVALVD